MNARESILPLQLNETTFSFPLHHFGSLTNFQFCSHLLIINNDLIHGTQTVRTPNMQVTGVYLCVDETPIVHIPNQPISLEETIYANTIDAVHCTPCTFFYDDIPLLTDHINSNNFAVVVTFNTPPLSVFWLEYDRLCSYQPALPRIFTVNGHSVSYYGGQIVLH